MAHREQVLLDPHPKPAGETLEDAEACRRR
jgi:hypothetical protein